MTSLSSPPSSSETFTLPDSRILSYATYGCPSSVDIPTILYFHGYPGSRIEAGWLAGQGLPTPAHIISIDRPGMGFSTFQPARRIVDWPADVLALVGHLQIKEFFILGDSGGSPYALVCAKEFPRERLKGTAVVSGVYPLSLGTEGMLWSLRVFLNAAPWLPQFVMKKIINWEMGGSMARNMDEKTFENAFMKVMANRPEKDRVCLEDAEFREIVTKSAMESFRQGSEGPAWEGKLYADWGFRLEEVNAENITLWHAKGDVNSPLQMAEKASKLIKGCEFRAVEDETHLSLPYNHLKEVVANLLKV